MNALPSGALAALRALTIGGSLLPLGGFAMWWLAQPSEAARVRLYRRLRIQVLTSVAVALVAGFGWLARVAARLAGAPTSLSAAAAQWRAVLSQTDFGYAWLLRAAALGLLLGLVLPRSAPSRARTATGLAAAAAAAVSLGLAGHAAASGLAWRLTADLAHLVAAGLWLGALPLLASALRAENLDPEAKFSVVRRFSRLGVACVATLLFSGLLNASPLGFSGARWWGSDYGRLLLVKITLFGVMLGLAAYNRLRLTPRLTGCDGRGAARALRASIAAELVVGALTIAVVGVLGATMPPSAG